MQMFSVPLRVPITKTKWFILNLNIFRNSHFFVLNKAKKLYKEEIQREIGRLSKYTKIRIELRLFPKTKRLCDLDNVLSIHCKFLQDALVESGTIPEDNYLIIPEVDFRFGEVDPENPRCEITIKELE